MADGNSSPASNTHGAVNDPPIPDAMPGGLPHAMPPLPKQVEMRQLELTFNGSAGESVTFKIKNTMKLRKAMEAYSARVQLPVDQLRFLFEGQRLGNEDTPAAVSAYLTPSLTEISLTIALARDGGRRHRRGPHGATWRRRL